MVYVTNFTSLRTFLLGLSMELLTLDVVTKEVTMVLQFSPAVLMACLTGYSYGLISLELETYLSTVPGWAS